MTVATLSDQSLAPTRRPLAVPGAMWLWGSLAVVAAMAVARIITDNNDLTSPGTFGVITAQGNRPRAVQIGLRVEF